MRGRIIKRVSADMAWVEIDGVRLLAQLQSPPREGTWLTFVIQQLSPEIVLKERFEARAASALRLEYAASFEAARTLFENQFRPFAFTVAKLVPRLRPHAFATLLGDERKLLATYLDTLACAREIVSGFPPDGHRLFYQPWLIPEARRQATIVRQSAKGSDSLLVTVLVEFELEPFGLVRAEFLNKKGETGYRLKLQRPELRDTLFRRLESVTGGLNPRCLGIAKLPQREHGGIVAELLFAQ
ncbi:MAG: hypothetical protein V3571_15265 [Pseudodesulfovibrio sp.]